MDYLKTIRDILDDTSERLRARQADGTEEPEPEYIGPWWAAPDEYDE